MQKILFIYPEHIKDIADKMENSMGERYNVRSVPFTHNVNSDMEKIDEYAAIVALMDAESGQDHWAYGLTFSIKETACLVVSLNQFRYEEEFYCSGLLWVLQSDGAKRRFINRLPGKVDKRIHDHEKSNREPDAIESIGGCLLGLIVMFLLIYFSAKYGVNAGVDGAVGGPGCSGKKC